MPPTKSQLENLQSMVAEIGVENVVEMAIKSAGGRPMDEGLRRGEIDARRRIEAIRNNAAYTAGLLSEALEKRNSTIKKNDGGVNHAYRCSL